MDGVFLPSLGKLLSSTQHLHSLSLQIPKVAFVTPDELLVSLANLTHLTFLSLDFPIVTPRHPNAGQPRPVSPSQIVALLPSLTQFVYCGEVHHLEALVAGIDMPAIESLNIKLFHRLTFTIPHLSDLIAGTMLLNQGSIARVDFTRLSSELHVYPRIEDARALSSKGVHIVVSGYQFDWQVHSMAQLCHALAPGLRNVQSLFLGHHLERLGLKWREEAQPLLWNTLLAGFERTKTLWVSKALVPEVGHALDPEVMEGSADDLMPVLDAIVASSDEVSWSLQPAVGNAFGPLHAARPAISLTYVDT
ncbi:hypothetical protein BC834DRAFT_1046062 [Gloeopeniophorella convolvens]|nr:hypothetical protein BC834DRAFT_1046062 [Gloeopeniophorella convolvens]